MLRTRCARQLGDLRTVEYRNSSVTLEKRQHVGQGAQFSLTSLQANYLSNNLKEGFQQSALFSLTCV